MKLKKNVSCVCKWFSLSEISESLLLLIKWNTFTSYHSLFIKLSWLTWFLFHSWRFGASSFDSLCPRWVFSADVHEYSLDIYVLYITFFSHKFENVLNGYYCWNFLPFFLQNWVLIIVYLLIFGFYILILKIDIWCFGLFNKACSTFQQNEL